MHLISKNFIPPPAHPPCTALENRACAQKGNYFNHFKFEQDLSLKRIIFMFQKYKNILTIVVLNKEIRIKMEIIQ